jgi:NDP-sugar pyrophosphorylase family protein
MKAMLFAAGEGTRLRPLTATRPKCLVSAAGRTLLEHNLLYLQAAGVDTVVINVHYLAEQILAFVAELNPRLSVHFSVEETLLETGGGLWLARKYFEQEEAFLVMNSDIYTELDLQQLLLHHRQTHNLATLAVADRKTSRYLRFDHRDRLCGWENRSTGESISWNTQAFQPLAFNGIQVLSPQIFAYMENRGPVFSTIPVFLDAARAGERVGAFTMNDTYWIDIGTKEKLAALEHYLTEKDY